ncbi:MAG: tRNA glutamyl-Q(34) synthetase GluQRS [Pseudomonadota bacterium]
MRSPSEPAFVTRFAPSPTGFMHLGHAYSALFAFESARRSGGRFLVRMEDIDQQRCRGEFERAILEDLAWLGIRWDGGIRRQSQSIDAYERALDRLRQMSLVYPCFCTRLQIRSEIAGSSRAPHGPSGELLYPGICKRLSTLEQETRIRDGEPFAWRLDTHSAVDRVGSLTWVDCREGEIEARPALLGDVVIARKDVPTSYHLAVTIDDHLQGITLVSRGRDLFHATHIQRLLQAILGLRTPKYYHHNLIVDAAGERLAKRNLALTIRHLRDRNTKPEDVWRLLDLDPVFLGPS